MEFDSNPTIQEILDELNKTPEGKAQLELAALRAVVAKQQVHIAQMSEQGDVSSVDDTGN